MGIVIHLQAPGGTLMIAVWIIISSYAIRNIQFRNVAIFITNLKLQELMLEKERIQEENHANEMRSLIANVAHDLKTVSITLIINCK